MNFTLYKKPVIILISLLSISLFAILTPSSTAGFVEMDPDPMQITLHSEPELSSFSIAETQLNLPVVLSTSSNQEANCRYGAASGDEGLGIVSTLGAGWALKFGSPYWLEEIPANNAEKVHIIKTHQLKTAEGQYLPGYRTNVPLGDNLAAYIRDNPGDLWIIGNEVERGPAPGEIEGGQGDMFPEIYAVAYHEVREFIKMNDRTARIAVSGLVEVTPGRLQYLDKVWQAYLDKYGIPMPVDVWNMHIYVLPELTPDGITPNGIANIALGTDPALGKRGSGGDPDLCSDPDVYCFAEHDDISIFAEQVLGMRQWMKAHGQQQKPLILSEFSILYPFIDDGDSCWVQDEYGNCFTPDRINDFMNNVFDYLNSAKGSDLGYALDDDRLVQQWLWFAVHENGPGSSSNLAEVDLKTLTVIGENYRDNVYAEPLYLNLLVDHVPQQIATIGPDGTAVANISVKFRNNGNSAVESPFKVTFYKDAGRTQEINSVLISPQLRGCATDIDMAAVEWSGLEPGKHQFWVKIDSENTIIEGPPGKDDNIGSGFVLVNTDKILLPAIRR